jgi:hypothetical protein
MSASVTLKGTYPTFEMAVRAVERARAAHGVQSGIVCHPDGSCSILYEPETHAGRRDRTAGD